VGVKVDKARRNDFARGVYTLRCAVTTKVSNTCYASVADRYVCLLAFCPGTVNHSTARNDQIVFHNVSPRCRLFFLLFLVFFLIFFLVFFLVFFFFLRRSVGVTKKYLYANTHFPRD
jgi:hypothetical protein